MIKTCKEPCSSKDSTLNHDSDNNFALISDQVTRYIIYVLNSISTQVSRVQSTRDKILNSSLWDLNVSVSRPHLIPIQVKAFDVSVKGSSAKSTTVGSAYSLGP
jgi:hypothetical protein